MGFESFRVELRGGPAQFRDVNEGLGKLEHIRHDLEAVLTPGSVFFVMDDGKHVIEIEVMDSPVKISCRFTLCHPPSVDAEFLALVRQLMVIFGMDVKICDDVQPGYPHSFSLNLDHIHDFAAIAVQCITARRSEWIAAFGSEQLPAKTNEVYAQIILPRCQTSIAKPTT